MTSRAWHQGWQTHTPPEEQGEGRGSYLVYIIEEL